MTKAINILVKDNQSNDDKGPLMGDAETQVTDVHNSWAAQMLVCLRLFLCFLLGVLIADTFVIPYLQNASIDEGCNTGSNSVLRATHVNWFEKNLYTPEQLHINMGKDDTEMYVTWSTMRPLPNATFLVYCKTNDGKTCISEKKVMGKMNQLNIVESDQDWIHTTGRSTRTIYTYNAIMTDLDHSPVSGNLYLYKVIATPFKNSKSYDSSTYQFIAKKLQDPLRELSVAFYGDLGLVNGQSISRLIRDVDDDRYDAIIHNGDFAYDLDTHLGEYGDEFMRKIEQVAARVPYQVSVGNHEAAQNFSHYDIRFSMIDSGRATDFKQNNFYYSFNMGPVHFIGFSTEFYYFLNYSGLEPLYHQYEWLKKDLAFASSNAERAKRPWIVVFGHRPMYCSSRDNDDCSKDQNILRKGLPFVGSFALEKLFFDYGVDVQLYSHEHQYERFLPIYDRQIKSGTDDPEDPYNNPKAPVHLISGSAGCQERLDPFKGNPATGSVKRISDYGFTRLSATRCALKFEQVSDDKSGLIVDSFIITKSRQNFPKVSRSEHPKNYDCMALVPSEA